jgi:hypothetical protein
MLILQSRLPKDTPESARRQVIGHLAWHRHLARFVGMLELPVAASLGHLDPAVVRQQPENIPNLHVLLFGPISLSSEQLIIPCPFSLVALLP